MGLFQRKVALLVQDNYPLRIAPEKISAEKFESFFIREK